MVQGPSFLITFLYYFSTTTLIVLLLASGGMRMSLETQIPYQLGTLSGAIAGLIGAYFNRSVTRSITFSDRHAFSNRLEASLAQMGFEKKTALEDFTVYTKSAFGKALAGKIFVKIEKDSATISGRSHNVKRLLQLSESSSR
jgi:hypothetical protein